MLEHFHINYDFSFILNNLYKGYKSDVLINAVKLPVMVEDYEPFGGLSKSYNEHNINLFRREWNKKIFNLKNIQKQLDLKHVLTITSLIQQPGNTLPVHRDKHYEADKKGLQNLQGSFVRANIFLEDWKPGHTLQYEIEGKWHSCINWRANDGIVWDQTHYHLSGNSGMQDKVTLQISGVRNE